MNDYTAHIQQFLGNQGIVLDEAEWRYFASIWSLVKVPKKEPLTRAGQTEKYLYFVLEGAQRVYYFDEQEREATLVLTYPYSFAGVLDSFLLQQPSVYSFEAISASTLLRTSHSQFVQAISQYPAIDAFMRTLGHYALSGLLARMAELQCFSSEEKFRRLLERSPHILQQVPHKYLANYLGIDATNFSKLINSVRM